MSESNRDPFDRTIALLDAPSNLGLMPPAPGREPGVRRLPDALRACGLMERLGAIDVGRVPAPAYHPELDPATGVRNASAIAAYAQALADALAPILACGDFPLVLGGDCSILLGSLLALRRRGHFGLCFVDGHQDLLTPVTSRTGGAAGMDLALACGVGPDRLIRYEGGSPLVAPADVLLLGDRSGDELYSDPAVQPLRAAMYCASLDELRQWGVSNAISEGLARLERRGVAGVWLHVDADVLDIPAIDSPQPDGLGWEEFHELLVAVLGSRLAVGMQVTILDPERDPEGRCIEAFADALEQAFRMARRLTDPRP